APPVQARPGTTGGGGLRCPGRRRGAAAARWWRWWPRSGRWRRARSRCRRRRGGPRGTPRGGRARGSGPRGTARPGGRGRRCGAGAGAGAWCLLVGVAEDDLALRGGVVRGVQGGEQGDEQGREAQQQRESAHVGVSFREGWGGPGEERGRPTGGWSAGLDGVQEVVRVGDPGGPRGVEGRLRPALLGEPDVASGVLGGQATADEAGRGGADGLVVVLVVGRDVAVVGRGDGEDLHRQSAEAGLLPGDGLAFVLGAGLPEGRLDDLRAG